MTKRVSVDSNRYDVLSQDEVEKYSETIIITRKEDG
jgi:hypothetical protein